MFKFALSEKVLLGSLVATAKIQRFSRLMIMNFRLSSEIALSQNKLKAKYSFNHDIWCNVWQKKTRLNQTTSTAWVITSTYIHFVEITLFKTKNISRYHGLSNLFLFYRCSCDSWFTEGVINKEEMWVHTGGFREFQCFEPILKEHTADAEIFGPATTCPGETKRYKYMFKTVGCS